MAAGLAHELNNPAAAAAAPRRSWPRRSTSSSSTIGRFVEAGIERERRRAARRAAARGARRAPRRRPRSSALDAADAEDELLERARGARRRRSRGSSPSRWRPPASTRPGSSASPRPPGRRTDAALRWVAASLTARGLAERAAGVDASACRASSARSSRTPTWTAATSSRSTSTRASRRRSTMLGHKLKHTTIEVVRDYDRDAARSSPCAAPSSTRCGRTCSTTRSTRSASTGTITITTRARRRLRAGRDHRRRPRHPAGGPRPHLRPVLHDQGRRRGHRPRPGHRAADRRRPPRRLADVRRPSPAARRSTCRCPFARRRPDAPAPTSTTSTITELPESVDGCEDCLATGGIWLHLRICLECGHVGCCDDSPNRHASAHAHGERPSDHPLARAGRGLVVVLRRRGRDADPGGQGPDAHPAVAPDVRLAAPGVRRYLPHTPHGRSST